MIQQYQTLYQKAKSAQALHPALNGEELFKLTNRSQYLTDLRQFVKAPPEHFDALYLNLLYNLAEFVQQLVSLHNPAEYWLDSALNRSQRALQLLDEHIYNAQAAAKMSTTYKAQLTYAVWSAALLQPVDEIVLYYSVHVCNEQGDNLSEWQPLIESLLAAGTHYQVKTAATVTDIQLHPISVFLTKQLVPTDSLIWLASNPRLLQEWLAAILGEDGRGSIIESILRMLPPTRTLPKEHLVLHPHPPVFPAHSDIEVPIRPQVTDNSVPPDIAQKFIEWLKQEIKIGRLSVNSPESWLQITLKGMLFIHPIVFQMFCRNQPNSTLWNQVYYKFCLFMNIPLRQGGNLIGFSNKTNTLQGILVPKAQAAQFFPQGQVPSANSYPTLGAGATQEQKKKMGNRKTEGF